MQIVTLQRQVKEGQQVKEEMAFVAEENRAMGERVKELEEQFRLMNEYHRQMFDDKTIQSKLL